MRSMSLGFPCGIPLGILEEARFESTEVALAVGDTLLHFTDGITEAMDGEHNLFGLKRNAGRLSGRNAYPPFGGHQPNSASDHLAPRVVRVTQQTLDDYGRHNKFDSKERRKYEHHPHTKLLNA